MKRGRCIFLFALLLILLSGCGTDAPSGTLPQIPAGPSTEPPSETPSNSPTEAPAPIPAETPSPTQTPEPPTQTPSEVPSEPPTPTQPPILVRILESKGFTVENNSQYIRPGEDVVFLLKLDSGYSLTDTDYDGVCHTAVKGRQIELTLENVQRPTNVSLRLASRYAAITYEPNGGTGEAATVTYDTYNHPRPNTSNGANLFVREDCTLVSWNTRPDGTGERVGLGSRVSVAIEGLTLYAQWAEWSAAADFTYRTDEETVTITGYHGSGSTVVIPSVIDGREVTAIASGAFRGGAMTELILPATMRTVEDGAFQNCALKTVTLFDNIESIGDAGFDGCGQLRTLRINAVELPYGANWRKESCYADKVDLLIQSRGQKKIVFYGGCSVWYNLDSSMLSPLLDQGYRVVNLGLNGTVNSSVQMQIMGNFLEDGDILFHTPELSSRQQLLIYQNMNEYDAILWCGLEYNYDLFALVDLRTVPGAFDSFCSYLSKKESRTDYNAVYMEDGYKTFCDEYGCVPFYRTDTKADLADRVFLDPAAVDGDGMARLKAFYDRYQAQGVRVYISYACVNMDNVPKKQQNNVEMMDRLFREAIEAMDGPVPISGLGDFLYHNKDFYDTNYHLLSKQARENTDIWLRDLQAQMEKDGLWKET